MSHFLILILFFVFLVCLKIHDYHMNHRSLPILELINVRNSLPLLTSVFLNEQPTSLCFCSYLTYSYLTTLASGSRKQPECYVREFCSTSTWAICHRNNASIMIDLSQFNSPFNQSNLLFLQCI